MHGEEEVKPKNLQKSDSSDHAPQGRTKLYTPKSHEKRTMAGRDKSTGRLSTEIDDHDDRDWYQPAMSASSQL